MNQSAMVLLIETPLAKYEAMRRQVASCAHVDEAKDLRDKAAALAAYARQRDDAELEIWTSEIKLRACRRIGQLSQELPKAAFGDGPRTAPRLPGGGKTKADTLAAAGISTSTAHTYEQLAGPREATAAKAAAAATDNYFARANADNRPTMAGLQKAVLEAIKPHVPLPKPRPKFERSIAAKLWLGLTGPIRALAEQHDINMDGVMAGAPPSLIEPHLERAMQARDLIVRFIKALEATR